MGVKKPLVYVAGPISSNPWGCLKEALVLWKPLRDAGAIPFFPQFGIAHAMIERTDYQEHFDYGVDMLLRCDLMLRLPGKSPGADAEQSIAEENDIPVIRLAVNFGFSPLADFNVFMQNWGHE